MGHIYAVLSANAETVREVIEIANGEVTLEEVLEEAGRIAKREKRGKARGEKMAGKRP